MTLLDFQLVLSRHNIRPPHFASKVSYSASPQASAKCPRGAPCSDATLAMLFALKTAQIFFWILNTQPNAASTPCPVQCHPSLPTPKYTRSFLLFLQAHSAEKSIRQSIPYASQRTTPQMRTHHAPDADVSRPRCGRITSQTRACLDPDALTSLIFRASLIINLLILSKWKISVVTTGKLVGNLRDKRNHHTTPRKPSPSV